MIPDARLFGPVGRPRCDCLKKTQDANYQEQFICEECEPLICKIERRVEAEDSNT